MLLRSAPYEAYFYDDDPRNIEDVRVACVNVHAILLPSDRVTQAELRCKIGQNKYLDFLVNLQQNGIVREDYISRGFDQMDRLVNWAAQGVPTHKTVFLIGTKPFP